MCIHVILTYRRSKNCYSSKAKRSTAHLIWSLQSKSPSSFSCLRISLPKCPSCIKIKAKTITRYVIIISLANFRISLRWFIQCRYICSILTWCNCSGNGYLNCIFALASLNSCNWFIVKKALQFSCLTFYEPYTCMYTRMKLLVSLTKFV